MAEPDCENEWISKSQEGDLQAFEALIKQYQHMIHSLIYRMTGSLSDAEDIAQETFITAYHQIGKFRREARFSSWLYRIAVNICLNWKKKKERHDQLHENYTPEEFSFGLDNEMAAKVQEALLKLNPKQRTAIILTVYDGLTHGEAARTLGCSETTVSWRIFMARKKLKQLLT